MSERTSGSRLAGDRQSVPIGQRPERFTIEDAGLPGNKVVWHVPVGIGRMELVDAEVRHDRTVSGQFIPYGPCDAEVTCIIGDDPGDAHTFRVSVMAEQDVLHSSDETPPGVPASWIRFTDEEVDALFRAHRSDLNDLYMDMDRPASDIRTVTAPPSDDPAPLREAVMPARAPVPCARPQVARTEEELLLSLPPDAPLTADERRSITGSRARRASSSLPVIAMVIVSVFVIGFGVIGLISHQNMTDGEAINEAAQRSAVLHAEAARAAPALSVPAPVVEPRRLGVIDLGCSTAPIRANPNGTYKMEVCVIH